MMQIVDNTNRDQFSNLLDAMFADRKRVFIDQLGWDLPITAARFEIDQFDDIHSVYIIAVDDAGGHLGSLRLLRTDRPHILGSLFPQMCDGDVPRGPQAREITRLCISPSAPRHHRRPIRNSLISAMVDHALNTGISALTGVVTVRFLDQILAMGWDCDQLGKRTALCGLDLGTFCARVDEHTPHKLTQTGIYACASLTTSSKAQAALAMMVSA